MARFLETWSRSTHPARRARSRRSSFTVSAFCLLLRPVSGNHRSRSRGEPGLPCRAPALPGALDAQRHGPLAPNQRPAVAAMLETVFAQESAAAACEQWTSVADALRGRFPERAAPLDRSREEVLIDMSVPREQWRQVASANPPERLSGEMKWRAAVVSILPDDRAVNRLGRADAGAERRAGVQPALHVAGKSELPER